MNVTTHIEPHQLPSLSRLLVLLDPATPSFCHYEVQETSLCALASPSLLEAAAAFAAQRNLSITTIGLGPEPPSAASDAIMSLSCSRTCSAGVFFCDLNEIAESDFPEHKPVLAVRVRLSDLPRLAETIGAVFDRVTRIDLRLCDVAAYREADFQQYHKQLECIRHDLCAKFRAGMALEINVITDRLLLHTMNNCGAGVTHITLAPNGRFYICPGFFYLWRDSHIGDLQSGLRVTNAHLLTLGHAPVCGRCDAYHCKRCVYLNRLMTRESNTPSHEQCRLAHIEREASRRLLEDLGRTNPVFSQMAPLAPLAHQDPIECILAEYGMPSIFHSEHNAGNQHE